MHIPYLKEKGFRVDLTNQENISNKGNIRWGCILHAGVGKNAQKLSIPNNQLTGVLPKDTRFNNFAGDIDKLFSNFNYSHGDLQRIYTNNEYQERFYPINSLDKIKKIIDRHFPEESCSNSLVSLNNSIAELKKENIPIRILAGLYACNLFISRIKD